MSAPPSAPSSSTQSPDSNYRVVRKRNRIPLSCGPCRHRKLKCDRTSPCQNCVRRGDGASCLYATPATRKRTTQSQSQTATTSPDDMQNRIDRLENLVLSLMTNGSQSAGPNAAGAAILSAGASSASSGQTFDRESEGLRMLDDEEDEAPGDDSDTDNVTQSFGIMKVDNECKMSYLGAGHWAAVLNDIAEVRNYFQTHKNQVEEQMHRVAQTKRDSNDDSGPALLFGASKPPPRSEILSQLPSRYLTDILVARYFNIFDPATHVLHGPVFQKQYKAHWANPSTTSIIWIAMLFALLRIALLSYVRDGDEPPEFAGKSLDLSNSYRIATANCLILGDYTKPHQHIIETLILHLHAEFSRNQDSEASIWVLVGMITRLAMRMGYHRDSKMFPNITPFQGEMRRRVWTFVRQADVLFSFQISLPSMIRIGDSDTELPRNIFDEEFDEESTALPPSRLSSEPTTVSYMITKARLAFAFGRVLEEVNRARSTPYEEILKIDKGLREIYEEIPEHLKLRPMREQHHLSFTQLTSRFYLAAIYHKSQCVLHRTFLRSARNNPRYTYSRRTCLESALALLDFQCTIHRETGEHGRLRSKNPWYTSLTSHDFLLAATIISTDLYLEKQRAETNASSTATSPRTHLGDSSSGRSGSTSDAYGFGMGMEHSQDDLLRLLEECKDIWTSLRDKSVEAYKASEILNILLTQLRAPDHITNSPNERQIYGNGTRNVAHGQVDEKQNAAMTLGLLSSGGKSPNGQVADLQMQNPPPHGNLFENNTGEFVQTGSGSAAANGSAFESQIGANASMPFLGMFGPGAPNVGEDMNLDWSAFDSYLQSPNMTLDPAHTLWSSVSPNSNFHPTELMATIDGSSNNPYSAAQNLTAYNANSNSGSASNPGDKTATPLDPSMQATAGPNERSPDQVLMGNLASQPKGFHAWR